MAFVTFHVFFALAAFYAAAMFDGRLRGTERWLTAVRAVRVAGWRVRDLGSEDVLEQMPPHGELAHAPYRELHRDVEPVAVVSLGGLA